MSNSQLVESLKESTSRVPPFAKERVWNRMQHPAPSRRRSMLIAAAALSVVLGFGVVAALQPKINAPLLAGRTIVWPQPGARYENATLTSGRILVSTWGDRISIHSGTHVVTSEASVFSMQTAGDSIDVQVSEGDVSVDGQSVLAAHGASPELSALHSLEPASAREERAWALTNAALKTSNIDAAVTQLDIIASSGTLGAEAALLKKGQIELWQKHAPRDAERTLSQLIERFPSGALREDAELSRLEALVDSERWADARTMAHQFVGTHSNSDRVAEVSLIEALAAWSSGARADACHALPKINRFSLSEKQQATFDTLSTRCISFER